MKKLMALTLMAFASIGLFAQSGKNLIVYFSLYKNQKAVETDANSGASRTLYGSKVAGNTEIIALMIQEEIGGDVVLLQTKNKFSNDGGNYDSGYYDEAKHSKNSKFKEITNKIDVSRYDTVFIGFPAWWYDMPDPTFDFLDKVDLSGKNVYVFCTHGGSGLMRSIAEIQKAEPNANVNKTGLAVSGGRVASAKNEVSAWLKKTGLKQ